MKKLLILLLISLSFGSYFPAVRLIDDTGTTYGVKQIQGKPRVSTMPYLFDIAEGNVTSHTPFGKMAFSSGATTSETDVWAGATTYTFLTSQRRLSLISSNANDSLGGTGINSIEIFYLDSSYAEKYCEVNLKGTTAVKTDSSNIFRINNLRAKTIGTQDKALGNIDVKDTNAATIYSRILTGNTRARNSIYTVPKSKTLYITSMSAGCGKGGSSGITALITLRATYDNLSNTNLTAGRFFMPYAEIQLQDGAWYREFELPLKFPEKTDIKCSVIAGQSSTIVTTNIRGWLE